MKPRAPRLLAILLLCLCVSLPFVRRAVPADNPPAPPVVDDTPPPLGSNTPPPPAQTPAAKAAVPAAPTRGTKRNEAVGSTPKPKRVRPVKEFSFPLPIHNTSHNFIIPQLGTAGEILSQMMATKITRIDNEHVEMHEAKIDLNHPDGKSDFHVILPDSIFDLKTHIISSDHPVTVQTEDFELTGESMEFNTVDRTGELKGHVHMVIHNFKQVAGVVPAAPAR